MIDLHSHSTFSDGSENPSRVVELAKEAGCRALALTDHDGLEGLTEARQRADDLEIELINGCEVSCAFEDRALHVLCYFIDGDSGPLQEELARLREDRERRNDEMIKRLQSLGLPITFDEVSQKAEGKGIGRPHMAAVLKDHGVVRDINEAFDRYLGQGRPGYVRKSRVTIEEIIDLTNRSGGISAVAHPYSLDLMPHELERNIAIWTEAGLGGLESYYSRYSAELRSQLVAMARRHGLVPTGGSDFHGSFKPDINMGRGTGDLEVPDEILEELRERCTRSRATLNGRGNSHGNSL
jgi:hypothetical protein